jgi:Tol biopolymer transport system component
VAYLRLPDGRWIAFDHRHETHSQIHLMDSEGRNMHAVTSGNYEDVVPGWSRGGTAVYFASNRIGSWAGIEAGACDGTGNPVLLTTVASQRLNRMSQRRSTGKFENRLLGPTI